MTLTVQELDLIGAQKDGMTRMELARELGVSRSSVTRAMKAYNVDLRIGICKMPMEEIRALAEDMPEAEAVEWLLGLIEEVLGGPDQEDCYWPGVNFTPKELALVQYLYRAEGKLRGKSQIISAIYSASEEPPVGKIIDVFVCKIRKKSVDLDFEIETVWGQGYRFVRKEGAIFPWEEQ